MKLAGSAEQERAKQRRILEKEEQGLQRNIDAVQRKIDDPNTTEKDREKLRNFLEGIYEEHQKGKKRIKKDIKEKGKKIRKKGREEYEQQLKDRSYELDAPQLLAGSQGIRRTEQG